MPDRDGQAPHDSHVQPDGGRAFDADPTQICRVERFQKRRRRAVDLHVAVHLEVPAVDYDKQKAAYDIADDDQHVIQTGEDAEPDHPLPEDVVALEVEIKGLIV